MASISIRNCGLAGDPFVRNGVIRSWQIRGWHEALQPA
jgi:hypothetical protein